MKTLIISTHFDDAILSAGQYIAGHPDPVVLTVFGGIPEEQVSTPYDQSCGFKNSKIAMEARRWEDGQATALLGAESRNLEWLDSQYTGFNGYEGIKPDLQKIDFTEFEKVLAPLGLRHPDHIAVSDAMIEIMPDNLYLYEDLPHRVTHPELVFERINYLAQDYFLDKEFIGDGQIELKMRALMAYKSQMLKGDLNPYNLYVAERFWKTWTN